MKPTKKQIIEFIENCLKLDGAFNNYHDDTMVDLHFGARIKRHIYVHFPCYPREALLKSCEQEFGHKLPTPKHERKRVVYRIAHDFMREFRRR